MPGLNITPTIVTRSLLMPLLCGDPGHWLRLMSLFRWVIGEGSISFWTNNWCGETLEGSLPCDQALTVAQAVEIAEDMSFLLPAKYQETLQDIRIVPHKDQLMFTPSESGEFVMKTYLELSRTCGATRMWPR